MLQCMLLITIHPDSTSLKFEMLLSNHGLIDTPFGSILCLLGACQGVGFPYKLKVMLVQC